MDKLETYAIQLISMEEATYLASNLIGWDELKLRYVLPQQICNNILPLDVPHPNNGDDSVVWILTNDGGYELLHKAMHNKIFSNLWSLKVMK